MSTLPPPSGRTLLDRVRLGGWAGLHRLPLRVVVEVVGDEPVCVVSGPDELLLEPGRNVVDFGRWTLPARGLLIEQLDRAIRVGRVRELDE